MSKTNHVRLIGNLGGNPKLVAAGQDNMILSVSMATHMTYKGSDGQKTTKTEWHNIVAFGKIANLLNEYTKKGSKLMIEGHLQTRQYVNKEGKEKYVTEVVAEEILFLDAKESIQG
jgi:single-strand DNA-binding protein